ncbi:MAG: cell division protein FtsA [Lentisphaeria bacterium]|nr:cell division protein FtsA [Lentisphaeria bacterium]
MTRYSKQFYTLIEFGTDKICVLYGSHDEAGRPVILSFSQKSSAGCVNKGMILDYNATMKILKQALHEADKGARIPDDRGEVYYLINGYPSYSAQGKGSVLLGDAGKKVTLEYVMNAVDQAKSLPEPEDKVRIGDYDSYFVIDRTSRCKDPIGQLAEQVDAYVHLVYTERKRVERINAMLRELGFEQGGEPMPSVIMPVFSTLTEDERNQGALLIDMGAGITTYTVIMLDGVLLSGTIPAGRNNVVNDLAIGLDIPYDFANTFLKESKLQKIRESGMNTLEYADSAVSRKRKIPLDSFEKIIQVRMREIFDLIKEQIDNKQLFNCIGSGCVLTGGGALIESSCAILQDVMGVHARIGEPAEIAGPGSEIFRYPLCCYSGLLGMLKYIQNNNTEAGPPRVGDALTNMFDSVLNQVRKATGALKI